MSTKKKIGVALLGLTFITGYFAIGADSAEAKETCGLASWYGNDHKGKRTANGERFNPGGLTAAHRTAKFGTRVTVRNARNGKSVVVRINDRGPFIKRRIIDVSKGAASQLGLISSGVGKVCISY